MTRSYDGILFQEIRKYPTFTTYNVFSLFFDENSNDIIIAGTPIGIESFYRGTIIPYGADFKFAPTNRNGTLYINGDKAWKKGSETFTLPDSAAAATADDNRYIIVSANGTVYTSEDGQSWASQGRIYSLISNVKKSSTIRFLKCIAHCVHLAGFLLITSLKIYQHGRQRVELTSQTSSMSISI